jgi:hypothetical protein
MTAIGVITGGRLFLIAPGVPLESASGTTTIVSGGGNTDTPSGLTNIALFGHGQSNAQFANDYDGALLEMAQAVSAYLEATGTAAKYSSPATDNGGTGVYCGFSGADSYLVWTADTVAAAQAAVYSSFGQAMMTYISTLTSDQMAQIQSLIVYWGETDSEFTDNTGGLAYTDKPVYKAALKNDFAQIRAALGKTAENCSISIFGPPYGNASGASMVREAWAEMALDPANNLNWIIRQTYDSITRGNNWNATTGVETTGTSPNDGHRDSADNVAFYRRGALAVARQVLANNGLSASLIPTPLGAGIGPQVIAAVLSGTTLTLTIQHDGGNDLVVPLLAQYGVGFWVLDGGTISTAWNFIQATACVRVDSTHLALTLARAPTNPVSECYLYYPFPAEFYSQQPLNEIGRGCAVTDNFGSVAVDVKFDLNQIIGQGWRVNMPLCSPVTINGDGANASALFGIALSS